MFKYSFLFASVLALSFSAIAQDNSPDEGWTLKTFEIKVDQRGSAIGDYTNAGWALEPINTDVPYMRFTCSPRHSLVATLYPRPEMLAQEEGKRVKQGVRKGILHIEGRESETVSWTHVKRRDIMQARRRSVSAKLYNAAATGADVRVRVPLSKDSITILSPEPDARFKDFIKKCNLAKQDTKTVD